MNRIYHILKHASLRKTAVFGKFLAAPETIFQTFDGQMNCQGHISNIAIISVHISTEHAFNV